MKHHLVKYTIIASAALLAAPLYAQAQNNQQSVITINPLFDYPVAPETLQNIEERCAWLLEHFWDSFDFKSKQALDQTALNHAFSVYCTPMQWAPKNISQQSVDRLIKNLEKNPTLLVQFTKAAEENLYGPRAEMWIDEIYIKFLKALVSNKKVTEARKARAADQLKRLQSSTIGTIAPSFTFIDLHGNDSRYFPMSTYTILVFGDPECDDCRMAALRLESNVAISSLVNQGKLNILFIIPDPDSNWTAGIGFLPQKWTVGASETVSDIMDLRTTPAIYIIGADGKIKMKNIPVNTAINTILNDFGQ